MSEEYKCKNCKRKTTILTLGDIYQGCAYCGSLAGFQERVKGKWVEKEHRTPQLNRLDNFLKTGK